MIYCHLLGVTSNDLSSFNYWNSKKKMIMIIVGSNNKIIIKTLGKANMDHVEIGFKHNVSLCKIVIYNYVLCWLYSIIKSVVIALILFLVFCGILLYWV